ncbi:30S ribosomal protein S12 methylthiotransferase RimO [Asticcacaulis excentricus]|uniref:Ribosomal protein uS12 methylthiotransferase RimO n=1 Tax=Asticcacaulis excentricus TaxID=78587 RepID=A0A3G9G377_9CAUL|nr:30S ribosomal protein S12 methylthiotransferase RimO [Asticcacaulis excentricus]BBF81116.1 ribosomal protein S12p Asp88methylthiotransferase [Asticcacaulis excentricus]
MSNAPAASDAPKVGFVSLGCPKALVDSERILTRLKGEGYATAAEYAGADVVVVNTCGFLDSARDESLNAIGEALAENGKVVVTGCLGAEADLIRERFPNVAAVTGAHQYEEVMEAVRRIVPAKPDPFRPLVPENDPGVRLTPKHYAYLKISEGCDHRCSFCIIPSLRGDLASRPVDEVLREAEVLAANGVKELLVVSQDTSAYGLDIRYAEGRWRNDYYKASFEDLSRGLGELGIWVRMHYVYPYPHVNSVIPLMAEGKILPYLDIPFQHASPKVLKAMRRPGNQDKTLERILSWREICPDLTLRSTFVVGFPGETEADFNLLLDWLEAAQIDRVGAFAYENVEGAAARDLPDHVPEEVKQDRLARFMAVASRISAQKLQNKVGQVVDVLVDEIRSDGVVVARTKGDAPEIDGHIYLKGFTGLNAGDYAKAKVTRADAYDLWGEPEGLIKLNRVPTARPAGRTHRLISRI